MLELNKILRDIDDFGRESAESITGLEEQFRRADAVMAEMSSDIGAANRRISEARTSWLLSNFDEPPDRTFRCPTLPDAHAVVAVDGSQIAPDKHQAASCFLINSASVTLFYGIPERPTFRSIPKLCYREEDTFEEYGGRKVPVAEKLLGIRRAMAESLEMLHAIRNATDRGVPIVALMDGSLIRWALESEPPDFRKKALETYLAPFEVARELGVPIAGYISDPGSRDFTNSMRVMLCDMPVVNCDACPHPQVEDRPCEELGRLVDRMLFKYRLEDGDRTVILTSKSRILDSYGEHAIRAFYLSVGREVSRVEIPLWVAEDPALLDRVHAVCVDQASKGSGYPVALSEAHDKAVVRGPERRTFYEMIERSLIKHGAPVSRSLKRISKGY